MLMLEKIASEFLKFLYVLTQCDGGVEMELNRNE